MKSPNETGKYIIGFNVNDGNGKSLVTFYGSPINLKEATDIWNEINSDDFERLSVYQITKVNPNYQTR